MKVDRALNKEIKLNQRLYEVTPSWSGIPTVYQKTDKVWSYYITILLVHSGLVIIVGKICKTRESSADEDFLVWTAAVLFAINRVKVVEKT